MLLDLKRFGEKELVYNLIPHQRREKFSDPLNYSLSYYCLFALRYDFCMFDGFSGLIWKEFEWSCEGFCRFYSGPIPWVKVASGRRNFQVKYVVKIIIVSKNSRRLHQVWITTCEIILFINLYFWEPYRQTIPISSLFESNFTSSSIFWCSLKIKTLFVKLAKEEANGWKSVYNNKHKVLHER